MPKYHLSFRIDFYPDWEGYKEFNKSLDQYTDEHTQNELSKMEHERKTRQDIYNSMGLKLYSFAWADAVLSDATAEIILKTVDDLNKKHIGFLGSGTLYEEYGDNESDPAEWYIIHSPNSGEDFSFWDPYPECKAYRHSPMLHIQNNHFVSEKFKECIEKNGLTGLKFLWVKDTGKYKAHQWYCAVAEKPMGHGIDHEWFSRESFKSHAFDEKSSKDSLDLKFRMSDRKQLLPANAKGRWNFDNRFLGDHWKTGSAAIDRLIPLFPKGCLGLNFVSMPRFQRKYLPDTDFAYMWSDEPDGPNAEGKIFRFRDLYFNRKARDMLLKNHLIDPKLVQRTILFDSIPEGCSDLDKDTPCPPPVYTNKEFIELKKLESRYYADFLKKEKPVKKPELKSSLAHLRKARQTRPDDFKSGINRKKLQELFNKFPFKFPDNWIEVLTISSGGAWGADDDGYAIIPIEDCVKNHQETVTNRKNNDEDYSGGLIYFGTNVCGDSIAFNKIETERVSDCPVVLISHEDFTIEREWESIADFLDTILLE